MEEERRKSKEEEEEENKEQEEGGEEMVEEQGQSKKQKKKEEETENDSDDDTQRNAFIQHLLNAMVTMRGGRGARASGNNNAELIENLKANGLLNSERVIEALMLIPRGEFVPREGELIVGLDFGGEAYIDAPLRLASMGFNISAPHMYCICLENLDIQPGNSFLDIGSGNSHDSIKILLFEGCGHFTALGGFLVGRSGTSLGVDLREDICAFARDNLKKLSKDTGLDFSNVQFTIRNCFLPFPDKKQFDRIHVGACCPESQKDKLFSLLAPNGILVTPYKDKLVKVKKDQKGNITMESLMSVAYSDLVVPSEAEIKETERQLERMKAQTIVVPESTYLQDISKQVNNQELSDVTFIVEGKPIYAHRTILAARSEHFKAMFFNGLRESKQNEVPLPDVQYDIFLDCLKYIYTDDVAMINSPDRAIEILGCSNYFKLDRLKAICEKIIKDSIEIENAAYILQYEAYQLKSYTMEFIMENYDQVSNTKCFDDLDKPLLVEVTKTAVKLLTKK